VIASEGLFYLILDVRLKTGRTPHALAFQGEDEMDTSVLVVLQLPVQRTKIQTIFTSGAHRTCQPNQGSSCSGMMILRRCY